VRPLDRLPSIKLKLGAIIVAAVGMSTFVIAVGVKLRLWPYLTVALAGVLALVMVQVLARGMTSPLGEMAVAARAMARGDYGRRVTASSRDEVGELARAFNQMAAELGEVDRVRRDLVANVSHELRTPISALQAVLENLLDGVSEPDPDTFRTMLAQVQRLGRLVSQLLDLSRLESGAVPLQPVRFGVGPLLQQAADEVRLGSEPVEVAVDVRPPALEAYGDPERVHQVVANLLENAVRHSPPGGRVDVAAVRENGHVRIEVNDQGPGIAPDDMERVFERFYRADAARAASDGGSGLGLSIARWIVDLHGGRIHADNRRPKGCRMVVELPERPR